MRISPLELENNWTVRGPTIGLREEDLFSGQLVPLI